MNKLRLAKQRGHEDKGWIESYHSFSFENYIDPEYVGYRSLRVLNEEYIKQKKGLGDQSLKDVELVTYVIEGSLEYRDNLGHIEIIKEGELCLLSAGIGVVHNENNLSEFPAHFLQLWFYPNQNGMAPSVSKKLFPSAARWGQWCLMVSQNGRDGSLRIHQDVDIFSSLLDREDEITFDTLPDRHYWVQIISGKFLVQKEIMSQGDGFAFTDEISLTVNCLEEGEVLLIDQA